MASLLASASNVRPAALSLPIVIVPPRPKEVTRSRKETLTTAWLSGVQEVTPILPRHSEEFVWDSGRRDDAQPEGKRIFIRTVREDHPATR